MSPDSEPVPALPPDAYRAERVQDDTGYVFLRYQAPFDRPRQLIDPTYWPRIFTSGSSAHISAVVLQTDSDKQLYWAECSGTNSLLRGLDRQSVIVLLESDVVPVHAEGGVYLPERSIQIIADGSVPGAAADASELASILNMSSVDGDIPVAAYAFYPSLANPDPGQTQILIDTRLS